MESLEESNCHSLSDSFSLYERYLRSFNVVNNFVEDNQRESSERVYANHVDYESSTSRGNIDLSVQANVDKHCQSAELQYSLLIPTTCDNVDRESFSDVHVAKHKFPCSLQPVFDQSANNSSTTPDNCLLNDHSEPTDAPVSSEDSKPERFKQPIFISSTMENSNNAVDSVPMFRSVVPSENVFKLPIRQLTFNGTLKHVQRLKSIVDPLSALCSSSSLVTGEKSYDHSSEADSSGNDNNATMSDIRNDSNSNCIEKSTESTGDSQYEECNGKKECSMLNEDGSSAKWNSEQSYSSLEASFDSGVRSPDMFSDNDDEAAPVPEPFWGFLNDFEAYDKKSVRKTELILQGVLPPPSVTTMKADVTQMLKKYYCFLPAFTNDIKVPIPETNSVTPTKRVSFVHIPTELSNSAQVTEQIEKDFTSNDRIGNSLSKDSVKLETELDTSANDKSIVLKASSQMEATETPWPEVLKCRHYGVHYNITKYSEQVESLAMRYGERYVGAETDTSVSIHSGGLQSPSSASKRKALRLAQAKSPGRRLSHLARRRQTFCSAATIGEKTQGNASKMVLIDKNFFPHRKLVNSSERRSPRKAIMRRTPGKKTPVRKTPGKKTPAKTPRTRSGGSSRKKAMRRLLMDPENITKSQPSNREPLKRALFVSPEGRKNVPMAPSTSVPLQAMKSKRALFGSPVTAETKSCDGSQSDQFLKRKRDAFDDEPISSRSKIAKSLSFGGDTVSSSQSFLLCRRASEVVMTKNMAELNDNHKQKLLWAVSVALRVHGWGMSRPGFREKASLLARLTRRLLTLPPHRARLANPHLSTSDTMHRVARIYAFAIIQGRTVEDCFEEEKTKLSNEVNTKVSGYISASAYQQLKEKQQTSTFTSQIKENSWSDSSTKQDQSRSSSKNILQDKLVNIDSNSNSSSGLSMLDRNSLSLFKSHSMPSFEEAAKMRARRQISFDNVDFPKR